MGSLNNPRPTIREVAARAGVSLATVSRVMNGSGYADSETKARVLAAASDLHYQPNVNWSRLRRQSSQTILFLLANLPRINTTHMRLLDACERTLHGRGYDLVFTRHEYSQRLAPGEIPFPRLLERSGAVDGVLLIGMHYANLLAALKERQIPYTMLANNFQGPDALLKHNCVVYDDRGAMQEATEYLIRLGHRRIAFIGNRSLPWFNRRYESYAAAMRLHGLEPSGVQQDWQVHNLDYGQLAAAQLLTESHLPTAIVTGNDELAAGAWKELTRRGVRIPHDVSLMGLGDRPEFAILEPSLTSVSIFEEQLGDRLTAMLLRRLEKPKQPQVSETYPCKLVERASCGPLRETVLMPRKAWK